MTSTSDTTSARDDDMPAYQQVCGFGERTKKSVTVLSLGPALRTSDELLLRYDVR